MCCSRNDLPSAQSDTSEAKNAKVSDDDRNIKTSEIVLSTFQWTEILITDNNLFSASLSSICLDDLCFKFSKLIKHDYLLHALLLFILHVQYCLFFSDWTFSV